MLNYYMFSALTDEMITWGQVPRSLYLDTLNIVARKLAEDDLPVSRLLVTQPANTVEPPLIAEYNWLKGQWR